jgi:hypothetical protein
MRDEKLIEIAERLRLAASAPDSPRRIEGIAAELRTLAERAQGVPEGWREFIEECAKTAGGEVCGNNLSARAKGLLAAAPQPATVNESLTTALYASPWSLIDIAEQSGARKDVIDDCTWWTLTENVFHGIAHRLIEVAQPATCNQPLQVQPEAKATAQPACTCPSGGGSLRWPCPQHPPTAAQPDAPQVSIVRIPAGDKLDPITIYFQDETTGRGRMTVTCYGDAWTACWGSMGNCTVREFVADVVDAGYLSGAMLQLRGASDSHRAYTLRIAARIISALSPEKEPNHE